VSSIENLQHGKIGKRLDSQNDDADDSQNDDEITERHDSASIGNLSLRFRHLSLRFRSFG
jgi:hypothetical protein